jgi:hypothetical protein
MIAQKPNKNSTNFLFPYKNLTNPGLRDLNVLQVKNASEN